MNFERVLVANRGEIARRLIRYFRGEGVETVSIFSESDVEQPWVEEADYSAYLNGKTVEETYLNAQRVVGAAMDAGCDAIHPGYCFLAEDVEFAQLAMTANLTVIGNDPRALALATDRFEVRKVAKRLGIPLVPASDILAEADDGIEAGNRLGIPLFVKSKSGNIIRRVDSLSHLTAAVQEVRAAAVLVSGDRGVYLERSLERVRACGTIVVRDRQGNCAHLGETDGSLQFDFHSWVEEVGEAVVGSSLHIKLGEKSVELAQALGWVGVGKARWAITPDGGIYLLGFSGRLTTGYELAERVHGIDLIDTQVRLHKNEPLGWQQSDVKLEQHGVQLRILRYGGHEEVVEGTIDRLVLPQGEGLLCETGTAEGQPSTPDTDPLLVKLTVTAPTRAAALTRAREALGELVIEGVPTNQAFLQELLSDSELWKGRYHTGTVAQRLAAAS